MGLTQYWSSLVRGWYFVLAGIVLGLVAALCYLQFATPQYTARTQVFVSTTGTPDVTAAAQGGQLSQQRTASYAQLIVGPDLAARVIDDVGLDLTVDQLTDKLTAEVLPETVIIDVQVQDDSPERALAIAESLGVQFQDLIADLETPPGATQAPLQVSVVAAPELPDEVSSPQPLPTLLAGLLGGLLLGGVVAVGRDRLDTSVRSDEEAAAASGAPVLGLVPEDPHSGKDLLSLPSGSPTAEAFRVIRTSLQFVTVDRNPRVLMVTSPDAAEGKTTTAICLAQALAAAGRRVLLVEADLRQPRTTRYLGAVSGAGLTNVLAETASVGEVLQPVGSSGLQLLAAGPTPPNPGELLASEAMAGFLDEMSRTYDLIILDAPPLLPVADAAGLSALSDGVVLCVRWGSTGRDRVVRARALLDRAGADTLGTVLTFAPHDRRGGYGYGDSDDAERHRGALRRILHQRRVQSQPVVDLPQPTATRRPGLRRRPGASSGATRATDIEAARTTG